MNNILRGAPPLLSVLLLPSCPCFHLCCPRCCCCPIAHASICVALAAVVAQLPMLPSTLPSVSVAPLPSPSVQVFHQLPVIALLSPSVFAIVGFFRAPSKISLISIAYEQHPQGSATTALGAIAELGFEH